MSWKPIDLEDCLSDVKRRHERGWGGWTLDVASQTLRLDDRYEVYLGECDTSAEVLDWICQVAKKRWATDRILAGLVRALDDVLEPQANLCSWGRSSRLGSRQIKTLIGAWRQ